MIRPAKADDRSALIGLAEATSLFHGAELEELDQILVDYFAGKLGNHHAWIVDEEDGLKAAAYYAPEPMTSGTWNLYFIGVQPELQGKGVGRAMLEYIEHELTELGERLLLVETSGLSSFAETHAFYKRNGYEEEAKIREFYRAGEDKIVYRKVLSTGR